MVDVSIRDEGENCVEDSAGRQHAEAARIQRHQGLQRQNDIAVDEEHCIEDEQRDRVVLPILRAAIQTFLEPTEQSRRLVVAVHDLRHVTAERNGDYYREDDYRDWQKPHKLGPLSMSAAVITRTTPAETIAVIR